MNGGWFRGVYYCFCCCFREKGIHLKNSSLFLLLLSTIHTENGELSVGLRLSQRVDGVADVGASRVVVNVIVLLLLFSQTITLIFDLTGILGRHAENVQRDEAEIVECAEAVT